MSEYPFIQTIRYMGNKGKLLDKIIPEIERLTSPGDIVCDIMAGTNAIGYALKGRNKIISNDNQFYSYVIAKCLLSSYKLPSLSVTHELDKDIEFNNHNAAFSFFADNYGDTYFSLEQCREIDSIRYAIQKIDGEKRYLYLTMLMSAMCKAQSTTGHFAQFLDKNHSRTATLRKLSITELFFDKLKDFDGFIEHGLQNKQFNLDYKELFALPGLDKVKCFYLDCPYTADQYSRFYHILETVCKYDNPHLTHKAKYRTNRALSDFCYKSKAAGEFENIISFCRSKGAKLVISYSNHGVIAPVTLLDIAKRYYESVAVKSVEYEHSSQGKGKIDIKELLFILE